MLILILESKQPINRLIFLQHEDPNHKSNVFIIVIKTYREACVFNLKLDFYTRININNSK